MLLKEQEPVQVVTKQLKKRNPIELTKPTSPFGMLCRGFESKVSLAKNQLKSETINFEAFKEVGNYFQKEHNLMFNKKKNRYMTVEETATHRAEKDKRRKEYQERMAKEEAVKDIPANK